MGGVGRGGVREVGVGEEGDERGGLRGREGYAKRGREEEGSMIRGRDKGGGRGER